MLAWCWCKLSSRYYGASAYSVVTSILKIVIAGWKIIVGQNPCGQIFKYKIKKSENLRVKYPMLGHLLHKVAIHKIFHLIITNQWYPAQEDNFYSNFFNSSIMLVGERVLNLLTLSILICMHFYVKVFEVWGVKWEKTSGQKFHVWTLLNKFHSHIFINLCEPYLPIDFYSQKTVTRSLKFAFRKLKS